MAFHPYPQVIPSVFNLSGFGPPRRLTGASTCPWIDHFASGLDRATERPVRTRFRYGSPTRVNLATQRKLAGSFFKRHAVTPHKEKLRRIVGTRFQVLFHSPPGVLFTFPSRYLSAIGHQEVFRLNGWSRQIRTEFQEFRATWEKHQRSPILTPTGLSPSAAPLSNGLQLQMRFLTAWPAGRRTHTLPQPPYRNPCRVSHDRGLASSDFARHYSRNHNCFLFLWVLRCFTSPRSLHTPYTFRRG